MIAEIVELSCFTFFYAATPDCHKNFELLCDAASLLEQELGKGRFKVVLTISGQENKYAQWLYKKFGSVSSIEFAGFMSRENFLVIIMQLIALCFRQRWKHGDYPYLNLWQRVSRCF